MCQSLGPQMQCSQVEFLRGDWSWGFRSNQQLNQFINSLYFRRGMSLVGWNKSMGTCLWQLYLVPSTFPSHSLLLSCYEVSTLLYHMLSATMFNFTTASKKWGQLSMRWWTEINLFLIYVDFLLYLVTVTKNWLTLLYWGLDLFLDK
jgi:hypothetical protein